MSAPAKRFSEDVGRVLGAWTVLLVLEHFVIGARFSRAFAGGWELAIARNFLTPIVLGGLLPFAVALSLVATFVRTPRAVAIAASLFGGVVGYGVSFGRHFASWGIRAPFIALVGFLSAAAALLLLRAVQRMPATRSATLLVALSVTCWFVDSTVLPRLYPAFHWALFALCLFCSGSASLLLARGRRPRPQWHAVTAVALVALCFVPAASSRVRSADNLRLILLDHAPLMGRAVLLAARVAPPPPIDASDPTTVTADPARSLDWTSRDIVLITIDALRADHVSSYGYSRTTTPNIDALARSGTRFEHAYCPTPHTSYSVTSLLTGKYMRPLLSLGVGDDSETWAGYLRRYGYRTAAFYPPAVFFIDEQKFRGFKERGLDFEYKKEEFAEPKLRSEQVQKYIGEVPRALPLFLWVHIFEPHEPYVNHPEYPFGDPTKPTDVDAYDSEIAASDALVGTIVEHVKKTRPSAVFIVSADHGEEFGDHGGRYHGTTVYEEQVRVPLVIAGEGISTQSVSQPVQTIDLLATTLSALGIPKPPRVVGRDLGPLLSGKEKDGPGFAYAETDDYNLVAKGAERLVCQRKIGACALYDLGSDATEQRDLAPLQPERAMTLRKLLVATERANGTFEKGTLLPEAIRRALGRERDASADVAALLDDANPSIRRKAAEGIFRLSAPTPDHAAFAALAQLERACGREEDPEAKRWCSLCLVRLDRSPVPVPSERDAWLHDERAHLADAAALTFAERGEAAASDSLLAAWKRGPHDFDDSRELLRAMGVIRARGAVPILLGQLDDVRLRPYIFETLAAIGDTSVRPQLLHTFAEERYVTSRAQEANALLALGAKEEMREALERFAGMPEPFSGVLSAAARANALSALPAGRGATFVKRRASVTVSVELKTAGEYRVFVLLDAGSAVRPPSMHFDGQSIEPSTRTGHWAELTADAGTHRLEIVSETENIEAFWLVPRVPELPPPAPKAWDAGTEGSRVIGNP